MTQDILTSINTKDNLSSISNVITEAGSLPTVSRTLPGQIHLGSPAIINVFPPPAIFTKNETSIETTGTNIDIDLQTTSTTNILPSASTKFNSQKAMSSLPSINDVLKYQVEASQGVKRARKATVDQIQSNKIGNYFSKHKQ